MKIEDLPDDMRRRVKKVTFKVAPIDEIDEIEFHPQVNTMPTRAYIREPRY